MVRTVAELERLAEKNDVVRQKVAEFEKQVEELKEQAAIGGGLTIDDQRLIKQYAVQSAEALRGYGIMVAEEAFADMPFQPASE